MAKYIIGFLAGAAVALFCGGLVVQLLGGMAHMDKGVARMGYEGDGVVYGGDAGDLIEIRGQGLVYDPGRINVPRESRERRYIGDGVYELEIIKRAVREERELWECREREYSGKVFPDCMLISGMSEGEPGALE